MKNILIKIIGTACTHTNDDVYENIIHYIGNKKYINGYGFFPTQNLDGIARQFHFSEAYSNTSTDKKIWHFIISTNDPVSGQELAILANNIALLFASDYQCFYGIDSDKGHPHIHFAVNTYSYHPKQTVLTKNEFETYIFQIQNLLSVRYPNAYIQTQWEGDE